MLKSYPKIELEKFISKKNADVVTEDGLDLLKRMLIYDKNLRITPIDAM